MLNYSRNRAQSKPNRSLSLEGGPSFHGPYNLTQNFCSFKVDS